jgi:mannosyltransferase
MTGAQNHPSRFTSHVSRPAPSFGALTSNPMILLTILLTGFALRLYKLGAPSLWYDETVSAFLANQPIFDLIAHTARDIHPPGYYLLLHFWAAAASHSEFALAFFSLIFGVLLISLTYRLARQLTNQRTATWAALLTALSPYHIWYSQEARMYTLGAVLGLAATYCAIRALSGSQAFDTLKKPVMYRFWLGYFIFATIGLYTLYYFAFLLIVINLLFLAYILWPTKFCALRGSVIPERRSQTGANRIGGTNKIGLERPAFVSLLLVNGMVLAAYLPWLPTAWRQAINPPVPPWRAPIDFWSIILESWSALSLGQSVEPATVWPILLLTLTLFILGLFYLNRPVHLAPLLPFSSACPERSRRAPLPPPSPAPLLLSAYTFGPLLLIYLLSFVTPLYHVRYIFTYAPAFYIVLGAGLSWLTVRTRSWLVLVVASLLLGASLFSVYQLHFNPRYRADDYRAATDFIQSHWQPGDVILINAGYTYTAFVYYTNLPNVERKRLVPYQPPTDLNHPLLLQTGSVNGDPQLGWGDPRSDFYAMNASETITALESVSSDFSRLWMLRAYDTVTDPMALIRTWLADNTTLLEDELFAGESNIRAQGFLLAKEPQLLGQTVYFEDGMALTGWYLPEQTWQPGQTIHVKLGWMATFSPSVDYKMSLKLWTGTGELAAQGQDEWPIGTLYRATDWPIGQTIYHPTQLTLPAHLPPGQYWLNVELYHPDTFQSLSRLDGSDPVVTLGLVIVQ